MSVVFSEIDGKTEARLSKSSSGELFTSIAKAIEDQYNIHWLNKLNGLDQRYWDFEIDNLILTLHLEHFLGISLFPANNTADIMRANETVMTIGTFINEQF